jgi:hypothetical protein
MNLFILKRVNLAQTRGIADTDKTYPPITGPITGPKNGLTV